jgi:alkylation response protein AidB-like acyl-CoA dehydrogenase
MHLKLSDEDLAFRDRMRTFFTTQIPEEIRASHAGGGRLTREDFVNSQQILNANGLAVPHWPVEWGGNDWTPVQRHLWRDEMQLASVPDPLSFNTDMVGPVIAEFGSPEQKQRFLPATANLDIWWCQGFSEPEAGSDLASLRTRAVRDGQDYIVNGQKTWTTLAQHADWIFCLVRTNPDAPKRQAGISFLLIDMKTPGVTVRPIKLVDGSYEVNEVWFEDVRVPAENLVGEENAGWSYAKFLLTNERTGVARVGFSKVAVARAKQRAAETKVGSGTLLDDPIFAARIAQLETDLLALELTQLRVVASAADGKPNPASSLLKLRGSELQQAATEILMDVAGPDSLPVDAGDIASPTWAQRSAQRYLNFRKVSIYSGSSEVQRNIISSSILGL